MARLFSKRNRPPPLEVSYEISAQVRRRILAVLESYSAGSLGGLRRILDDVGNRLIKEYGGLCAPGYEAARLSDDPVEEHFYSCDDEQALDFIEACFQSFGYQGGQKGVEEINEIFCEHGIGYELTRFTEYEVEKEVALYGRKKKRTVIEREYPQILRKDHQLIHKQVIEPALELLSGPMLRVANSEMLKAHAAVRDGDYEDAITLCGSAFESVLKTICDAKKWPHDPDRDTFAKLIEICRDHGLFSPFYVPIFVATGTFETSWVTPTVADPSGRTQSVDAKPTICCR